MLETLLCRIFVGAPKACAYAYLTTKPNPRYTVDVTAKQDYQNLNHRVFNQLRHFLRAMEKKCNRLETGSTTWRNREKMLRATARTIRPLLELNTAPLDRRDGSRARVWRGHDARTRGALLRWGDGALELLDASYAKTTDTTDSRSISLQCGKVAVGQFEDF